MYTNKEIKLTQSKEKLRKKTGHFFTVFESFSILPVICLQKGSSCLLSRALLLYVLPFSSSAVKLAAAQPDGTFKLTSVTNLQNKQ